MVGEIADRLNQADRILFITGAGVSAASGLPTYRGIGGLYTDNEEEGMPIERILSATIFKVRPELTWKHIARVERAGRGAKPNRAHEIMAQLDRPDRPAWVVTQNVDGLHRSAGHRHLLEIHGCLYQLSCTRCAWRIDVKHYGELPGGMPPHCPDCGALVRPDVVLFEEMLPEAATDALARELETGFDAVFSVGTSAMFPYVIQPVLRAHSERKLTVEINPSETTLSRSVDFHLQTDAVTALEAIAARL